MHFAFFIFNWGDVVTPSFMLEINGDPKQIVAYGIDNHYDFGKLIVLVMQGWHDCNSHSQIGSLVLSFYYR